MDKQFYESESIRVKSLEHLKYYEFDSVDNSNEEKALSRKEKKQKEDEKFMMFVKMHDILKYGGKSGTSIRMKSNLGLSGSAFT